MPFVKDEFRPPTLSAAEFLANEDTWEKDHYGLLFEIIRNEISGFHTYRLVIPLNITITDIYAVYDDFQDKISRATHSGVDSAIAQFNAAEITRSIVSQDGDRIVPYNRGVWPDREIIFNVIRYNYRFDHCERVRPEGIEIIKNQKGK